MINYCFKTLKFGGVCFGATDNWNMAAGEESAQDIDGPATFKGQKKMER